MSQKLIKLFINAIYSKGPKKNYSTNKTEIYHIDDILSLDMLDLIDYGPEYNRGYRYVFVIIDNFSNFWWTVPLKNKKVQSIKDSFEKIIISSRRSLNLIETNREKGFYNSTFQNFSINNNIIHYSRNTSLGAVFAERFNRTIRDLLKRPVFEVDQSNWINKIPTKTKQYNNQKYASSKLTTIQASLKKNEGWVY